MRATGGLAGCVTLELGGPLPWSRRGAVAADYMRITCAGLKLVVHGIAAYEDREGQRLSDPPREWLRVGTTSSIIFIR